MICAVNGVELYYEVSGEGTPVVLLHGNSESHEIFDILMKDLSKSRRVYALDSRGHGRSTRTKDLGYAQMASDVLAFIHALHLEKPVLYGFSDGGIVGLLAAMREPALLGKLIVSGANLNPGGLRTGTRLSIFLVALTGNRLYRMMLREPHIAPEALAGITVPTVVLAGEHDVIRRCHTELLAASIPGSTLEILPHETHDSYIIHSEKLFPILKKYL